MKTSVIRIATACACTGALFLGSGGATKALAGDTAAAPAERAVAGAAIVGGALPGGAIISAKSAAVAPVAGGPITAVPISSDGSFRAAGLPPGAYRLAITSVTVPRQTQGATFGEKVNAGLHAAGSALAQGARKADSMPNRISMNVTVAKQTRLVVVDDTTIAIEVGQDGLLSGTVAAP